MNRYQESFDQLISKQKRFSDLEKKLNENSPFGKWEVLGTIPEKDLDKELLRIKKEQPETDVSILEV